MKRNWIKIFALCATVLLISMPFIFASMPPESGLTKGTTFKSGQTVVLPKDTDHRGDMFIAGSSVILTGKVRGNVFVACGDLKISDFEIDGSLFVACGNADINAVIDGQVYVACGSLIDKSKVFGDYKVGAGSSILSGDYHGEVSMASGDEPGAVFEGNAELLNITGSKVTIGKNAKVEGQINISVPKNVTPNYPESMRDQVKVTTYDNPNQSIANILSIKDFIVGLIVAFLIGFFIFHFGRNKAEKIVSNIKNHFFMSLLWGLVATISLPIVCFIVLLLLAPASIIPMLALFFMYLFAFYAGMILFSQWVGELVFQMLKKTSNVYVTLAVGIMITFSVIYLLAMIPAISIFAIIVKILIAVSGFGAILLSMFKKDHAIQ